MVPSFHNADKPTHRRVMVVGMLFCFAFVAISFSLRPQPESGHVLSRLTGWSGRPASRTKPISLHHKSASRSTSNGPAISRRAICVTSRCR